MNTDTPRELLVLATFHKPYHVRPDSSWLKPCTVGAFRMDAADAFCDADGENISALNPFFCELTALYWAWKNLKNVRHFGLYHYRRYLYLGPSFLNAPRVPIDEPRAAMDAMASEESGQRALQWLSYADAIVPMPYRLGGAIAQEYVAHHDRAHWQLFVDVLMAQNPEYRRYRGFFDHSNRFTYCNMFIFGWERFEHYCSKLFPLMNEVFERAERPADKYQARYIGFLAERFMMFYLHAEGLRTHETPIVGMEPGA